MTPAKVNNAYAKINKAPAKINKTPAPIKQTLNKENKTEQN